MRMTRPWLLGSVAVLAVATCGGDGPSGPPANEDGHTFTYAPPAQAPAVNSISLRGEFNGWGTTPMAHQPDGSWRAIVQLEPGLYEYKFFINNAWPSDMCHDLQWGHPGADYWIDPDADGCVSDGVGGRNAVASIGDGPGLQFSHSPATAAHVSQAAGRISVRFRAHQGEVQSATVTADGAVEPMHLQLRTGLQEVWRGVLPAGATSYGFSIETRTGTETFGPYLVPGNLFTAVPWVGDAIGYQIFPERFWNGDLTNDQYTLTTDSYNYKDVGGTEPVFTEGWAGEVGESHCCHQYFGGDFQGILDRLDHLESLGVSFIYLNPIFTSGSAHGYDTYDYLEVAPNFGDEALLRDLLDAAGARGMRLMWDFVPNHVGVGFWAFQDAVTLGESSEYWNWFEFRVPASEIQVGNGNHYDAWWGFGSLPRLDTRRADVMEHLMDVTRYWTEFGFAGIRVDVPNEIRNRTQFYHAFRATAKAIDPEVYLVGEVWERDASWLQGDQFDALMNYAIGQGVVEPFARGDLTASAAASEMALVYAEYPEASTAMQFNLISSHDTARLLTKMGGGPLFGTATPTARARQRLASAMLYALPGVPVTFQGDECAFLGTGEGPREENRYPFQWEACDAAMLEHYRRLGDLRQSLDALRTPALRAHAGSGPLLSFYRGEPGPGEVLAVFNNSQSAQAVSLPSGQWTDAATGATAAGTVEVPGLGWMYLRRD